MRSLELESPTLLALDVLGFGAVGPGRGAGPGKGWLLEDPFPLLRFGFAVRLHSCSLNNAAIRPGVTGRMLRSLNDRVRVDLLSGISSLE